MKTKKTQLKYVEWLSAEDMHLTSKQWLSELSFLKDEQLFFEDLIRKYIFELITPDQFKKTTKIVESLSDSRKRTEELIKLVEAHERGLEVMVDGVDEMIEEEVYKNEHRRLIVMFSEFLKEYKDLKQTIFTTVKKIAKSEKKD
ncbi:hypothetical protein CSC81_04675 [Tenacibaculum discolor]|uniref:Uncharacterized protein n=1 Tax=Tenacibaculum discolor TaxID=361581 RepID=A0A2G1BUG7_9FLAO|nr:hypothetical protein [Tenacibaculum discolor]MDP2542711.1 hypothetical protein [Tenacibaculum discolor]PHN97710.1 hypothetical protein CSC81_04675 [Tenacibaculum discolor]